MLRGHYCNARLTGERATWAITAAHGIWRDDAHRAAASVGKHQPAVTDTFIECLVPNCGISRHPSHRSTTSWCTPFTSLPSTTA